MRAPEPEPGVLFAIPQYPPPVTGGQERQAHDLARALLARGVPVRVVAERLPGQPAEAVQDGVRVYRIRPAPGVLGPLARAAGLAWRMAVLRREYRVVHLHNMSWFAVLVLTVAGLLRRPVLTKISRVGGIPEQLARPFGRAWLWAFKRSDAMAALTEQGAQELHAAGFPPERVLRVTNGVCGEVFSPAPGPRPAREAPRAVYLGRLSEEKGVLELVEAWPRVLARVPRARLELYGDGPLADDVAARVRALGIEASVTLRGSTADVPAVLRAADVFVLPSHHEGNSNALLEAMACGVAAVATRVGGTPMLVGEAGAAWLVEPGDAAALGERIARLLGDPARRAALGEALLARARAHFDMEVVADVYLRAYRCLAAGQAVGVGALSSPLFDCPAPAPASRGSGRPGAGCDPVSAEL